VRQVFLVGFMGAGKSTVGRIVAAQSGMSFIDLDDRIENRAGISIAEIFASSGEDEFRRLESEELATAASEGSVVVACGGGVVLADENRRLMKESGCVAYLVVTPEQALARIGGAESRPLLTGKSGEVAACLLAARRSLYESASDVMVDTVGSTPDQVAEQVLGYLSDCGRSAHE